MKILVPVDGSAYTKHMLAYLATHDELLSPNQKYTVVHAVPALPKRMAAAVAKETLVAWHDESADKVFKPIRAFLKKHGIEADYVAKAEEPADLVCRTATKGKFDLVVLGSHGHGAVMNLVAGSVATKVLAGCKTPVLLVR